jgi:hypothetical protein
MWLKAPEGIVNVAIGDHQFIANSQGLVKVPKEIAAQLIDSGFTLAGPPVPEKELEKKHYHKG